MKTLANLLQTLSIAVLVIGAHALILWGLITAQSAPPEKPIKPPRPIQVSLITPTPPAPPAAVVPTPLPPPKAEVKPPPPKAVTKPPPPPKKVKPKKKVVKAKPKPKPKPKPRKVEQPKPKPKVAPKPVAKAPPAPVQTAQVSQPAPVARPVQRVAAAPAKPAPVKAAPAPATKPIFNAGYLNNPPPKYPRVSKRRGEEGVVSLRVKVSPQGRAIEVRLNRSSGSSRLDKAAQKTVKKWRFVPAKQGNTPITAWVIVPIHFKLER